MNFERESEDNLAQNENEGAFDRSHFYWEKAIEDGRASKTAFYRQVFESEDTQIYREMADNQTILLIAKAMNETWIGVNREGRRDHQN